jgi:hypothetical protein
MMPARPHTQERRGPGSRSIRMVEYIGVGDVERLVNAIGPGEFMARLAAEIEADYRRWP